jgi:hypothetical protein
MGATSLVLPAGFRRIVRILCALLLTAACAATARAEDATLSAQAIDFANKNSAAYKQAVEYAKHGPKAEIPVPPVFAPPCHACGDTSESKTDTDVDKWMKDSFEPEAGYSQTIGSIAKQVELLKGGDLSSEALRALSQFGDEKSSLANMALLAERVYEKKALPMAEKYDSDPQRAYAGIQFLLSATRQYLLLVPDLPVKTVANDDYALSLAKKWIKSISNKIEQDIFEGKKYNLCPEYASVVRQLLLLGDAEPDLAEFQKTIEKIQKMMYFDVNLNLHVHVIPKDGNGGGDETWSGNAKLHLNIDFKNACYTPEYVDGGNMTMTVKDLSFHDDEGNPVTLVSSPNYVIPLGQPKINLCDNDPVLDTGMGGPGIPDETIRYKGKAVPSMVLAAYLNIATMKNSMDLGLPMASGSSAMGSGSAAQGQGFANAAQQIAQIQQQIMSHSSDPNWISSPDGQAAMAAMQAAATGARQDASALNQQARAHRPVSVGGTLRVPWTNGDAQPVLRNVTATGDDGNLQLKITVQNAPQQ